MCHIQTASLWPISPITGRKSAHLSVSEPSYSAHWPEGSAASSGWPEQRHKTKWVRNPGRAPEFSPQNLGRLSERQYEKTHRPPPKVLLLIRGLPSKCDLEKTAMKQKAGHGKNAFTVTGTHKPAKTMQADVVIDCHGQTMAMAETWSTACF